MKAIFYILLFVTISSFGQIKNNSALEMGLYNAFYRIEKEEINFNFPTYYAAYSFDLEYKGIFVKNVIETVFDRYELSFMPCFIEYKINAGYQINNIELGYFHSCLHPIYGNNMPIYSGGENKLYLKIKFRQ